MRRRDIKQFLKNVLGPNIQLVDQGEWVSTSCPFAAWKHARGTDSKPSFGVKENAYDHSVYNCLTCKSKGTLPWLLKELEKYTGESYRDLIREVEDDELLGGSLPEWDERRSYDSKNDVLGEPVGNEYLDIYHEAVGHPYLRERGITDETAESLDIRYDDDDNGHERILFPVYSDSGDFYGYTGRATQDGVEPRIRDYFGLPKRLLLLGSEYISKRSRMVILVEGLFDFANGFQLGLPCVAVLHSGLTDAQSAILKRINLPVYIFFDDDDAGRSGEEVARKALSEHVPVLGVDYPLDATVWDERNNRWRPPQDPGELNRAQFDEMIEDAVLL